MQKMVMVAQPLPDPPDGDAGGGGRIGAMAAASSAAATENSTPSRADVRLAFADLVAAQTRGAELAAAGDRVRALADVLGQARGCRRCSGLRSASRRTRGAGNRCRSRRGRARIEPPRAGDAGGFLHRRADPSRLAAVGVSRRRLRSRQLVEQAESIRGELLALRRETEWRSSLTRCQSAADPRAGSRRGRSRPRRTAATAQRGSPRTQLFHSSIARAPSGRSRSRRPPRRKPGSTPSLDGLRGQIASVPSSGASGCRGEGPLSGRRRSGARIKSSESHRSATTRANEESWNCSTRTEPAEPPGSGRRRSTPPCGRQRSSSNS